MAEVNDQQPDQPGYEEYLSWRIPEYEKHQRGFRWYLIGSIMAAVLAGLSIFTPNFLFDSPNYLFLIIIVLSAAILLLINVMAGEVDFTITSDGIEVGDKFYDYDELKNFCVLFKPREELKSLYFEFKSNFRPRLHIPLGDANPLEVREILLAFLNEDLDRTDESSIDYLSKMFKL